MAIIGTLTIVYSSQKYPLCSKATLFVAKSSPVTYPSNGGEGTVTPPIIIHKAMHLDNELRLEI